MTDANDFPLANFRISLAAKMRMDHLRVQQEVQSGVTTGLAFISWAIYTSQDGRETEDVLVGFYDKGQNEAVKHALQIVDGVPLIFLTTKKYVHFFAKKTLDVEGDRFVLR